MKSLLIASLVAVSSVTAFADGEKGRDLMFTTAPLKIKTGAVTLLRIAPRVPTFALPSDMTVKIGDNTLPTFECPATPAPLRCALVPIAVEQKPGLVEITAAWMEGTTKQTRATFITVEAEKFPETQLTVDPDRANPNPEEVKRMEAEKEALNAAYAKGATTPLWKDKFTLPVPGTITSRFGGRRLFNGELKSVHYGTDLKAAMGAPIHAANDGTVIMAKEFFLGGNMVILDHGAGLFSAYGHLSKFAVELGQKIKRGQLLGKAGATGRVTGPHLHWAIRVGGVLVDPVQTKDIFNQMWDKSTVESLGAKPQLPSSRKTRFKPFNEATR